MEAHIVDDGAVHVEDQRPAGWSQAFVLEGFGSVVIVGLEQPLGRNRLDPPGGDVDAGREGLGEGHQHGAPVRQQDVEQVARAVIGDGGDRAQDTRRPTDDRAADQIGLQELVLVLGAGIWSRAT